MAWFVLDYTVCKLWFIGEQTCTCSFVSRTPRSHKSQVLKVGYILFLISEGWINVCIVLTFSPKSKSCRAHESFCGISTLTGSSARLTHLTRVWLPYYGGQNLPFDLLPFWELGQWPGPSSTSKATIWQSDSLHALQGCKAGNPDSLVRVFDPRAKGTRAGWNTQQYWMSTAPSAQPPGSAGEN